MSGRFILGGKPMGIGIGLHTGKAILGNIGSQTKIEYTAIGDNVNTASRFQELTKFFNEFTIIMSRNAWKELAGHPHYPAITNLGMQKIRGKKQKIEAFGFKPLKDYPPSMAHGDRVLMPFQRIKGA
jgi:class 3 adenylate cyclase